MDIIDFIILSKIKGIGNIRAREVIQKYENITYLFEISYNEIVDNFGKVVAENIINSDFKLLKEEAEKEVEKADKNKINIIPITDDRYPKNLKEIPDAPVYIYHKGRLPIPENAVAVVGTRKYSQYGKFVAEHFCKYLAENGINVVSGMATGIDTIAHKVCIENGGFTTAVLGNGLDIIFPPENRNLFFKIIDNGAIISEFPLGTKPTKYTFPQRNRLIAGLSMAVFVVEAPSKSGSLITAGYANDYGRVVLTVPANINNPSSVGNNELIKEGASILLSPEDFKEHIPFLFSGYKSIDFTDLSDKEKKILDIIKNPMHIEEIVQKAEIPYEEVMQILFMLTYKGILSEENGFYQRNIL